MNKYVIKILNTINVITRPTKDFIFRHLARRLEKLPTPVVDSVNQWFLTGGGTPPLGAYVNFQGGESANVFYNMFFFNERFLAYCMIISA